MKAAQTKLRKFYAATDRACLKRLFIIDGSQVATDTVVAGIILPENYRGDLSATFSIELDTTQEHTLYLGERIRQSVDEAEKISRRVFTCTPDKISWIREVCNRAIKRKDCIYGGELDKVATVMVNCDSFNFVRDDEDTVWKTIIEDGIKAHRYSTVVAQKLLTILDFMDCGEKPITVFTSHCRNALVFWDGACLCSMLLPLVSEEKLALTRQAFVTALTVQDAELCLKMAVGGNSK